MGKGARKTEKAYEEEEGSGQKWNEVPKPWKEKENLPDAKAASKTSHSFFIQPLDTDEKKILPHGSETIFTNHNNHIRSHCPLVHTIYIKNQ
jgi:hypothetical protein